MDSLTAVAFVIAGLILLAGGGEALVRAATTIAEIAGVSPAVIGLTVVAIGTSIPELAVSLFAALRGEPELAVANVVGSNIFNIAATLGLTAIIVPLPVHGSAVRLEWPVMFAASLMCLIVARGGLIDRIEGVVLLAMLGLFIAYTVRLARRVGAVEARQLQDHVHARDIGDANANVGRPGFPVTLLILTVGIAALVAGGRLLVDGAVALARVVGMSERVIGLTIVAAGTGAPELATSLVAALRRHTDVAVANMIGSNIFNILGILGVTALLTPVPVSAALVQSDMLWMIGTSLLLFPLLRSGARLSRAEGGLLASTYIVYLIVLLAA